MLSLDVAGRLSIPDQQCKSLIPRGFALTFCLDEANEHLKGEQDFPLGMLYRYGNGCGMYSAVHLTIAARIRTCHYKLPTTCLHLWVIHTYTHTNTHWLHNTFAVIMFSALTMSDLAQQAPHFHVVFVLYISPSHSVHLFVSLSLLFMFLCLFICVIWVNVLHRSNHHHHHLITKPCPHLHQRTIHYSHLHQPMTPYSHPHQPTILYSHHHQPMILYSHLHHPTIPYFRLRHTIHFFHLHHTALKSQQLLALRHTKCFFHLHLTIIHTSASAHTPIHADPPTPLKNIQNPHLQHLPPPLIQKAREAILETPPCILPQGGSQCMNFIRCPPFMYTHMHLHVCTYAHIHFVFMTRMHIRASVLLYDFFCTRSFASLYVAEVCILYLITLYICIFVFSCKGMGGDTVHAYCVPTRMAQCTHSPCMCPPHPTYRSPGNRSAVVRGPPFPPIVLGLDVAGGLSNPNTICLG